MKVVPDPQALRRHAIEAGDLRLASLIERRVRCEHQRTTGSAAQRAYLTLVRLLELGGE